MSAEQPRIYRTLAGKKLEHFYSIRIEVVKDSKVVTFCSKIHRNKEVQIPFSWSLEFTDEQILNDSDLATAVIRRWGDVWDSRN